MITGTLVAIYLRSGEELLQLFTANRSYFFEKGEDMRKEQEGCQPSNACACGTAVERTSESTMNSSTKDKVEGTFHEVKGAIKEAAGKLTDNPKLKAEGTVEKIAGKAQEKIGEVKQVFGK